MLSAILPGEEPISLARTWKLTSLDSTVVMEDSKVHVLLATEQLLEQTNPKDLPELVDQVRTKLAQRCYKLNANQSLLLNLPPESLVEIGKQVLELRQLGGHPQYQNRSKSWLTKIILPLLQTCTQLRTQLRPLRSSRLTRFITTDRLWTGVLRAVRKWRRKGFHDGPTTLIVSLVSCHHTSSYTAAIAGALECAIYGSLSKPPTVYIELMTRIGTSKMERLRRFYLSYRRSEYMLVDFQGTALLEDPASRLSYEEGVKIWDQARAATRDRAP